MEDKYQLYSDASKYLDLASSAKDSNRIDEYIKYLKEAAIALYKYAKLEYDPIKQKEATERADRIYSVIKSFETNKPKTFQKNTGNDKKTLKNEDDDSEGSDLVAAQSDTTFDDVVGLDYAKGIINDELIERFNPKYSKLYEFVDFPSGILLFGVPGTGKTLFARAIAGEIKAPFYYKSAKDLISKYVGDSSKQIAALFEELRKNKLSVLLLDDCDELFGKRTENSQSYDVAVANAIIREMDGFEKHKDNVVIVVATTNRPNTFDSAILRRFPIKIKIDLPNKELRMKMLKKYTTNGEQTLDDETIDYIASKTEKFSGADIKHLCEDAYRVLRKKNRKRIDNEEEVLPLGKEDMIEALSHRRAEVKLEDLIAIEEFDHLYGSSARNDVEASEDENSKKKVETDEQIEKEEKEENIAPTDNYEKEYVYPNASLLNNFDANEQEDISDFIEKCSTKISDKLQEFNITANVNNVIVGPTFIRFDLKLGKGVAIASVKRYLEDIEKCLQCNIRLSDDATSEYLGLEVPNPKRRIVGLKEVLGNKLDNSFEIGLGKKVDDNVFYLSNRDFTHILIGGTTNAGKSSLIHAIICQLIMNCSPKEMRFVMIDTKRVELSYYGDLPHLACNIIKTKEEALEEMQALIREQSRRYKLIENAKCRNIEEYNEKSETKEPYLIVIIDELAELANKNFLDMLSLLAAQGRAAGIKIIAATQRPSAEIIRGDVKANFPTRIALTVASSIDSRIILDHVDAEKLVGKGDMLVSNNNEIVRVQAPFVTTEEIKRITGFIENNK